jgi:hypothetical protein
MPWRVRSVPIFAALLLSSCGFIGIDLLDGQYGALRDAGDGAIEGGPGDDDGSVSNDGGSSSDASRADAGQETDGGSENDAGGRLDGSPSDARVSDANVAPPSDASATDAQTPPACAAGFADCDSTPLTCETQLGTVNDCSSCNDVCPANGGTAICNARSCATACDATGTYAIKITVSVTWPTGVLNGGSGTSVLWSRFTGTQSGNNLVGTLQPCGFVLPDFSLNPLVANELYQLTLPNTLFDHIPPYIQPVSTTLSSPGGFLLGAAFSMPSTSFQVGANLTNPASDPWPSVAMLPTLDIDADGKAGVTANYTSGGGYLLPRANMTGTTRSDRGYSATRFSLTAAGSGTSCSELNGTVNFSNFDTHIAGCHISGGADCTTTQRDTLDMGRPLFAPTSATLRAIKVAANATCTAVRAALP